MGLQLDRFARMLRTGPSLIHGTVNRIAWMPGYGYHNRAAPSAIGHHPCYGRVAPLSRKYDSPVECDRT
jgi:hypothetical protein